MGNFSTFHNAVLKAVQHQLEPLIESHREELNEALKNDIFGGGGPNRINRKSTSLDIYLGRVFQGCSEIYKSIDTLEDIAFYIGRFPFEGTRINRDKYLQFHVEAHYSEIYILKERLVAYITLFKRQFKKDPQLHNVEAKCTSLIEAINGFLSADVEIRGRHIHEIRFRDENIDRLSTIGLLARSKRPDFAEAFQAYYLHEHKKVRRLWKEKTKSNLKAIKDHLDKICEALFPMVFDPNTGALRQPRGIRA